MHCVNCGTSLPPEAENCPACQAATPYNHPGFTQKPDPVVQEQTLRAEEIPQQDFPTTASTLPWQQPFRAEQTVRADNVPPQADLASDATLPVQPTTEPGNKGYTPQYNPYNPYATPTPASSYAYNVNTQATGRSGSGPVYPPYPLQPGQQGARPQPANSNKLLVGLTLLAIVLLLGGAGLLGYTTVIHPAMLHAQATATAEAIATKNANATATANAQATVTAIAQAHAQATADARATAQAAATATANQAIYASATSGAPAINDSLAQNSNTNWSEGSGSDGSCTFTGGALHSSIHTAHTFLPCIAQNATVTNFAAQVDMTLIKGDDGGIVFRSNSAGTQFYIFRITSDGTYSLSKYVDNSGKNAQVLSDGTSAIIKSGAGQKNTIAVVARGNSIYLYVNKQYIANVTDTSYGSGQFGVFAGDYQNATEVAFSNAEIWSL